MTTLMSTAATPRSAATWGAAGATTVASSISMNRPPATSSARPRETPAVDACGVRSSTASAMLGSFRDHRTGTGCRHADERVEGRRRQPGRRAVGRVANGRLETGPQRDGAHPGSRAAATLAWSAAAVVLGRLGFRRPSATAPATTSGTGLGRPVASVGRVIGPTVAGSISGWRFDAGRARGEPVAPVQLQELLVRLPDESANDLPGRGAVV